MVRNEFRTSICSARLSHSRSPDGNGSCEPSTSRARTRCQQVLDLSRILVVSKRPADDQRQARPRPPGEIGALVESRQPDVHRQRDAKLFPIPFPRILQLLERRAQHVLDNEQTRPRGVTNRRSGAIAPCATRACWCSALIAEMSCRTR